MKKILLAGLLVACAHESCCAMLDNLTFVDEIKSLGGSAGILKEDCAKIVGKVFDAHPEGLSEEQTKLMVNVDKFSEIMSYSNWQNRMMNVLLPDEMPPVSRQQLPNSTSPASPPLPSSSSQPSGVAVDRRTSPERVPPTASASSYGSCNPDGMSDDELLAAAIAMSTSCSSSSSSGSSSQPSGFAVGSRTSPNSVSPTSPPLPGSSSSSSLPSSGCCLSSVLPPPPPPSIMLLDTPPTSPTENPQSSAFPSLVVPAISSSSSSSSAPAQRRTLHIMQNTEPEHAEWANTLINYKQLSCTSEDFDLNAFRASLNQQLARKFDRFFGSDDPQTIKGILNSFIFDEAIYGKPTGVKVSYGDKLLLQIATIGDGACGYRAMDPDDERATKVAYQDYDEGKNTTFGEFSLSRRDLIGELLKEENLNNEYIRSLIAPEINARADADRESVKAYLKKIQVENIDMNVPEISGVCDAIAYLQEKNLVIVSSAEDNAFHTYHIGTVLHKYENPRLRGMPFNSNNTIFLLYDDHHFSKALLTD